MNNAILIKIDDWEGLYVEGILVDEGHTLNEGEDRAIYFNELGKTHGFDIADMKTVWKDGDDAFVEEVHCCGSFPALLSEIPNATA